MYTSSFFNSVNGDRKYKADAFAEYFASFIGNGVFSNPSDGMQIVASTGMTVAVKAGRAWINGYFLRNFDSTPVILATAHGTYDRIDRVVLRWSLADRSIDIAVKQGTYSATPAPEPLRRDADIYELAVADVLVPKGAVTITQANITDTRLNSDLCGIVKGTIEEIDTTTIFNQYNDWYNAFTNQANSEFMDWFESIRDILDENTAAHLLNLINGKQDRITASGLLKSDGTTVTAAVPGVDYASGDALSKINRIVITGEGGVGDTVSLMPDGSVVRAIGNGAETLTHSQDKAFNSDRLAPVSVRLTDTKFAHIYGVSTNLYCVISDVEGETIKYGTQQLIGTTGNAASSVGACKYDTTATDCKVYVLFPHVTSMRCYRISVNLSTNGITVGAEVTVVTDGSRSNLVCFSPTTNSVVFTCQSGTYIYAHRSFMSGLNVNSTTGGAATSIICNLGSLTVVSTTISLYAGSNAAVPENTNIVIINTTSGSTVTVKDSLSVQFGFSSPMFATLLIAPGKVLIVGSDAPADKPYSDRIAVIADVDASGNSTFSSVFKFRDYTKSTAVKNFVNCGNGFYKAYGIGSSLVIKMSSDTTRIESMWVAPDRVFAAVPWAEVMSGFDILTWFESGAGRHTVAHRYNGRVLGVAESKNGGELTIASRGEYITENLVPGKDHYLQRNGTIGAEVTFRNIGTALTNKRLLLKEGEIYR